ncbi:CARM1 (predicted), partial [Pycnogonum litorale]
HSCIMATTFSGVIISTLTDSGELERKQQSPFSISFSQKDDNPVVKFISSDGLTTETELRNADAARVGHHGYILTLNNESIFLRFQNSNDANRFHGIVEHFKNDRLSVFEARTEETSSIQYFQFYGYLSQQQNMMQDFIRTSTYQQAMLSNLDDFKDKIILDVGAGSGILSFFAVQAGAKRVYAVEASTMAVHAEKLVKNNNLSDRIIVIPGKIEEIDIPEPIDVIISEPMGYMLFNERMLETYLHAKKWLKPNGKMFPTRGDLHVAPFSDETLFMEQYQKANFWYQESFHGVDLSSLRQAAVIEYLKQPIVDTFDIRICLAKTLRYTVDFLTSSETDLHDIEIPLWFELTKSGTIHGLAYWFDVAFIGQAQTVWLSTAPTEPLTHWYQVRCLLETPIFAKRGQIITG